MKARKVLGWLTSIIFALSVLVALMFDWKSASPAEYLFFTIFLILSAVFFLVFFIAYMIMRSKNIKSLDPKK